MKEILQQLQLQLLQQQTQQLQQLQQQQQWYMLKLTQYIDPFKFSHCNKITPVN